MDRREFIAYASVFAGFIVSNPNAAIRLLGYIIWMGTNLFWFLDSRARKDKSQEKMWGLYLISVVWGLANSIYAMVI